MHVIPRLPATEGAKRPKFRCDQCQRSRHTNNFRPLYEDGRTIFLSQVCRECEGEDPLHAALRDLWRCSWQNATSRNRDFSLRLQDVIGLWVRQNGRCALTGREMDAAGRFDRTRNPDMPSLDRINSAAGYINGNVHLVCSAINMMKAEHSVEEFVQWCGAVALHAERLNLVTGEKAA